MHNIVIIDTAGRLGVDEEMMAQAAAIRDATDPDEILFVVDAMIGQDAVTTAQAFLDGVGYDGVVLTKLDGDARGGAALSIAELTGRPVMFASSGEKLEDFDVFHPDRMASRILDLGDMLTLIEQAEQTFDQEQTAALAGKLASGEGFTLEDFVQQLAMVRKLGPIGNLLGMLPGAAQNRELLSQVSDKDLDRAAAIVNSMTPAERRNPKIINGSRRARIAAGSGVTVGEVSNLVVRFLEGQKMMRQMMGGGGMPGMPGMPGARRASKQAKKTKKKQKGGRPGGSPPAPLGSSRRGCRWAPSRGRPGPGAAWAGCPGTFLLVSAARAGSGCRGLGPAGTAGRRICRPACAAAGRTAAARRAGRALSPGRSTAGLASGPATEGWPGLRAVRPEGRQAGGTRDRPGPRCLTSANVARRPRSYSRAGDRMGACWPRAGAPRAADLRLAPFARGRPARRCPASSNAGECRWRLWARADGGRRRWAWPAGPIP